MSSEPTGPDHIRISSGLEPEATPAADCLASHAQQHTNQQAGGMPSALGSADDATTAVPAAPSLGSKRPDPDQHQGLQQGKAVPNAASSSCPPAAVSAEGLEAGCNSEAGGQLPNVESSSGHEAPVRRAHLQGKHVPLMSQNLACGQFSRLEDPDRHEGAPLENHPRHNQRLPADPPEPVQMEREPRSETEASIAADSGRRQPKARSSSHQTSSQVSPASIAASSSFGMASCTAQVRPPRMAAQLTLLPCQVACCAMHSPHL